MLIVKTFRRAVLFLTFFACLSVVWSGDVSGQTSQSAATQSDARAAIQDGARFEETRQWLDAIEHYEKSLKTWPKNDSLRYGLRRSKFQFSINRRYDDLSFERRLLRKSRYESLQLFDDVLQQIQAHYVSTVSATSYVAHGTESLYLALGNEKFLAFHLPNAESSRVREMRSLLKNSYWNKPVANSTVARHTVEQVADTAGRMLGLPATAVVMEYVFGGCNSLDDYSGCLTPDRYTDLNGNIEGNFVGLGIEMKADLGKGLRLINVLPESPAAEGGMRRGELIVSIEGADCRRMSTDEAAKLLRGPSGSRVRLSLESPVDGRIRDAVFARRSVQVKSIPIARIINEDHGIGYIQMTGFQRTTLRELDAALSKLHRQGMRSLIWDLRGNPGGLLDTSAEVLDRFIDNGVLVSTRGRSSADNETRTAYQRGTWQTPLVLLVDGDSASASEIVAGAIRDHRRGTIIGRKTYGKWSVQSIFPLGGKLGLRLTTALFYSPNGSNHSKVGVKPHYVIAAAPEHTTAYRGFSDESSIENDADVIKGIEVLKQQLTRR
jgi:carboxyl-terminal processing protease